MSRESADIVVGADGGGSGCRALVMDLNGEQLGSAQGPPALIDPSNPGAAADAIGQTVMEALSGTDNSRPARALWTGLAGAGSSGAREAVEIALRSKGLARMTLVGMDVEGAHFDAFGREPGVLLAVGTGSMVWGRDPSGREMRVGGWGGFLGEEGSGYWFGLEGLRAVMRATDRRDPPTLLAPLILEELDFAEARELVPWIANASKGEVAALAPIVLDAASQGDATAWAIRDRGVESLGSHLEVAREAWASWGSPFPLALAGGLLDPGGPLREAMEEEAASHEAEVRPHQVIPVRGAALRALGLASGT